MKPLLIFFGIILVLFVMQAAGAMWQIKDFQRAIKRVHQYGNVGLGQKRGGLTAGYLTLIACDENGVITYGERMTGITILSKCKPFQELMGRDLVGTHIDEFMDEFRKLDKRGYRQMKGYIQAMDALERRIYPERFDPDELPKLSLEPRINHRKVDLEQQ